MASSPSKFRRPFAQMRGGPHRFGHDSSSGVGEIPPLFAQEEPADRQAPQSRDVLLTGCREKTRTGSAVLQAALSFLIWRLAFSRPQGAADDLARRRQWEFSAEFDDARILVRGEAGGGGNA